MPNENNTTALSGNKGEWSEIYIFLKLLDDGKVYAADKDMNLIPTVYLNILKIFLKYYEKKYRVIFMNIKQVKLLKST